MQGLSCPMACGILLPQPGIKPMSPATEGRFPTSGLPGKSPWSLLKNYFFLIFWIRSVAFLSTSIQTTRRRQWHPTPVLLPGKSHWWRSLVGCSPWGHEESDTTEWLHFPFSLLCIGEGNGNPLQCSCLENPRDGEAWWADVYGVTQSQTRLKWLSSSSSSTPNQKKVSAAILISEQISEQGKLSGIKRDIT